MNPLIKILVYLTVIPLGFVLLFPVICFGWVWGVVITAFTDAAQSGREYWRAASIRP
jgi:energy-coupling factor transporter transmembrane protein EcfT